MSALHTAQPAAGQARAWPQPAEAGPAPAVPGLPAGRRLSVAYFSNSLARGGAEEHLLTLLRGLDRERFETALICTPELAEQIASDLPADCELVRLSLRAPWHLAAAGRLGAWFRKRRPDVLHSHLFYASLMASPIARLAGIPVVIETPHVREQWRRGWIKSRFFVDRCASLMVDRYIAVSSANAAYLRREKRLPAQKIVAIPNGCDCERFRALPEPSAALREQLQIPPQAPVLVVVARLEPQKGHAVLLRALPRVLASFPATRLICVGAGSLAADLRAEAGALRVAHAVRFAGFQADIRPFLALAAISILPSFYEGMPLVAMESLAAGVAMIATDVDGTPEIIVHGQTGLLVPPGDPAALAAAILRLLADDSLRAALAANGQAWVRRRFDRHRQIQATQELYVSAWRESCEKRAYARGGAAWDGDSMHQERSS
ncbi:MAG TPA: glycosyltransferase [Terriglobales bacterium]|nr:glycosyltransferase [Terriglobales bacterium]